MSAVDLKEMMLHVERIVRPVRAVERRKLQMRRELLGHLQTALEEERAAGAEPAAAWEAAKKRLGDPGSLTAELKKSVPWFERQIAPWPGLQVRWLKGMRGRITLGLYGMRWPWQMIFIMGFSLWTWFPLWLEIGLWSDFGRRRPEAVFMPHPWYFPAAVLVASLTCAAVFFAGVIVLDASASNSPWRRFVRQGAALTCVYVAAQGILCMLLDRSWLFLGWGVAEGVVMTALLAWIGRFLRPGVRDLTEWFELKVA
jgi:hypothetical protein